MFNTIKSKVTVITLTMLVTFILILSIFACVYYNNFKSIILWSGSYYIDNFTKPINNEIIRTEDNVKDLALIGQQHKKFGGSDYTISVIKEVFGNYPDSLGGGIWYEPYLLHSNKKRSCIYVYRDKNDNLLQDKFFESEEYNYPEQNWYKEIFSNIENRYQVVWSHPYYGSAGGGTFMITAGAGIFDENNKLIGISAVDWEILAIVKAIKDIKPTPNSFVLFADEKRDYIIASNDKYLNNPELTGKSLKNIPWYNNNLREMTYFKYKNKTYIPYVRTMNNGMVVIVNVPKMELFSVLVGHLLIVSLLLIFMSLLIAAGLYLVLRKDILNPINKLIAIARKISNGETDIHLKLEKPLEFSELASTFDKMTMNIKQITREREKINSELSIAKSIQADSLPNVFPPFPEKQEFGIYASMMPAKEVGGDFYDFYFIDEDHFMFLIADVSGKGVPAALFMMTVKTLISNISQMGYSPEELVGVINNKIYENNKQGLFVTMFASIVNIKTGDTTFINCGHNPPLIKREGGKYEYLKLDTNVVLGVFDNIKYDVQTTKLNPGDTIFAYTDGVTEAINEQEEIYGETRLAECLNKTDANVTPFGILNSVKVDIHDYIQQIPQSDDLTVVVFRYNGNDTKTFRDKAIKDNYKPFYTWLYKICAEWGVDEITMNKIDMCAEEIFANIIFYAYPEKDGFIEVYVSNYEDKITMIFSDDGLAYNPLEKPDPDITLAASERSLGGLGIFMVKEMTSDIKYKRVEGRNFLFLEIKKENM